MRNFLNGCAIKFFIKLMTQRSLTKVMHSFSDIPKFGVVIGLVSALFKLSKCIFNRPLFAKIDQRIKVFVSGMIASLALRLATSSEVTMVKLLLYPRVIECIF